MYAETTTLNHLVVVPSDTSGGEYSFFQGFSKSLIEHYNTIFEALSIFPHDLIEIYSENIEYVFMKTVMSSLNINLIREDLLLKEMIDYSLCLNVIWSTKRTYDTTQDIVSKCKTEPLHISTKRNCNCTYIEELNEIETINTLLVDLAKRSILNNTNKKLTDFIEEYLETDPVKRDCGKIPFPVLMHNCSIPLIRPLISYGYKIDKIKPTTPGNGIAFYVEAMNELIEIIDEKSYERDDVQWMIKKNDIILFCPSMVPSLYNIKDKFWKDIFRKLNKNARDFIKLAIVRNQGYSNFTMSEEDAFDPYTNEIVGGFLLMRQMELRLFSNIVSILSTNQFAPAIRLPNSVMLHHDKLKEIATIITSSKNNVVRKLNKKVIAYNDSLKKNIGNELLNLSLHERDKILTICDFPIEWISIDSAPIMFTHEISRIGSTPGNLFADLALKGQQIQFPSSILTKVLILRSFQKKDPIKNMLLRALSFYKKDGKYKNIELTVHDISHVNELITSLNSFDGALVVFDCHGNHGGLKGHAWLQIGKDKVDIWKLAGKCRIPPIVVLSACSTHAIDGSYASVANGFLRCGSLSVIGTHAPVNSVHAATFVARLLHRISEFVPLAAKNRPITWRTIISMFFRMSYVTDVLRGLETKEKLINSEQYHSIHLKTNMSINSGNLNWFDAFLDLITTTSGITKNALQMILKEKFQFVDTMLYTQLGRPENIIFYDGNGLSNKTSGVNRALVPLNR